MMNDFLWVEKYRPHKVEDCILPKSVKETFNGFIKQGEIPNLLLSGTAGVGKTTIAKALCNELNADYYVINGSDEGRFLDTVRNQASNFASTVSLTSTSKHKVLIIDEADNTTPDVQLLLRANIETFQKNCRFIFTCNFKNRIIEPLHSRTTVVEFNVRFGDPECQITLPLIKTDLFDILYSASVDELSSLEVEFYQKYALTVVLAAEGYPAKPVKGRRILGLNQQTSDDCWVNHAGTGVDDKGDIISTGGRVLSCSAVGDSVYDAAIKAYRMMDSITLEGSHFRKDIGYRAL